MAGKSKAIAKREAAPDDEETEPLIKASIPSGLIGGSIAALPLEGGWAQSAGIDLVKEIIRDVKPTSAIERMMCEQMAVIHAQVMDLNRMAKRMEYLDQKEKAFGLVVKMQGEFRKTAAALKEWRAPV